MNRLRPVMVATEEVAGTYSILHSYLFDRREDLRLPTLFLLSAQGEIVKIYRELAAAAQMVDDVARIEATPAERLARAVPFPGNPYSSPGERNYFQFGLELSEQGFDKPALGAFERVAKVDPSAITFYNLGTLYMKAGRSSQAEGAFERALKLQPDNAESANSLGALRAQSGDVPGAIERFRAALAARPDYPDALNNLGFAFFQTGQGGQAFELYQKALKLRPDFPEAYNNLGIYYGQGGDLDRYFVGAHIVDEHRRIVAQCDSRLSGVWAHHPEGALEFELVLRTPWLRPGRYDVDLFVCNAGIIDACEGACAFEVKPEWPYPSAITDEGIWHNLVLPDFDYVLTTSPAYRVRPDTAAAGTPR